MFRKSSRLVRFLRWAMIIGVLISVLGRPVMVQEKQENEQSGEQLRSVMEKTFHQQPVRIQVQQRVETEGPGMSVSSHVSGTALRTPEWLYLELEIDRKSVLKKKAETERSSTTLRAIRKTKQGSPFVLKEAGEEKWKQAAVPSESNTGLLLYQMIQPVAYAKLISGVKKQGSAQIRDDACWKYSVSFHDKPLEQKILELEDRKYPKWKLKKNATVDLLSGSEFYWIRDRDRLLQKMESVLKTQITMRVSHPRIRQKKLISLQQVQRRDLQFSYDKEIQIPKKPREIYKATMK